MDLLIQLLGQIVFVYHLLEDLEVFALLDVLRSDVSNQIAYAIDVIRQGEAADSLYEDQAERFLVCGSYHITESDSKHDIDPPIVRPNITFSPVCIIDVLFYHPVIILVDLGHNDEKDGKEVCKTEVKD